MGTQERGIPNTMNGTNTTGEEQSRAEQSRAIYESDVSDTKLAGAKTARSLRRIAWIIVLDIEFATDRQI